MDWDPDFPDRSPMLEPLRGHADALRAHGDWPRRAALQALLDAHGISNAAGVRLRLIEDGAGAYEQRIRSRGEMPFGEGGWHDLFNVLAWLAYPLAKAALNDAHHGAAREEGARRGRRRDALTLFDESGAIVLSSDESLLEDLRAFRWKRLFVERREAVRSHMRFHVFGHALFEKALRPYVGLTAHALLLPVNPAVIAAPLAQQLEAADGLAAVAVPALASPQTLSPLPLLGVPGWWADNERAAFYDDASYFRSGRGKS
jgi:hypothetical protein